MSAIQWLKVIKPFFIVNNFIESCLKCYHLIQFINYNVYYNVIFEKDKFYLVADCVLRNSFNVDESLGYFLMAGAIVTII